MNMHVQIKKTFLDQIIPVVLGSATFFLILGWQPLEFGNIAWLQKDIDTVTNYLGWLFYRNTPWQFPLGANPNYGMEIGASIFYSASLPLFAIFFKTFSDLLPSTFQYVGLWLLLCFVLQAWFAWRLIGLISQDTLIKTCATGLFLFSPPMLFRLFGHNSLVGHWLILAGLYFCLAKDMRHKKFKWLALAVIASLVHPYLLAMIICLWLSDTFRRLLIKETTLQDVFFEYLLVTGGVLLSLWQVGFFLIEPGQPEVYGNILGYFLVKPSQAGVYGDFRFNLISLINPFTGLTDAYRWSYVLPSLPLRAGDYEGFNFLGLGIIVLFAIVLPRLIKQLRYMKFQLSWLPLICVCLGLSLFAITNSVGIGNITLSFWLPDEIVNAAGAIRASGRMFWPVFYLILWYLLFLLVNGSSRKIAAAILFCALLLQAVDTRAAWEPRRQRYAISGKSWDTPLRSPLWNALMTRYKKIRVIPAGLSPNYAVFAYLAATHGLPTDAVYLSRFDLYKYRKLLDYDTLMLRTGNYEADTLYVIESPYVAVARQHLGSKHCDMMATVDGFTVVAPAWYCDSTP
jgi:hypothetical protein